MRRLIAIFISISLFSLSSGVNAASESSWEVWEPVKNATASIGAEKQEVFYDPKNPAQIFVYPSCWVVHRDLKEIFSPNCLVKKSKGQLLVDKSLKNKDGYITGVIWGDPKMEISFWSWIFRKPKFGSTSVSIWDGEKWLYIKGLPEVK